MNLQTQKLYNEIIKLSEFSYLFTLSEFIEQPEKCLKELEKYTNMRKRLDRDEIS